MKGKWISTCSCVFITLILDTVTGNERTDIDTSHVRLWTGWYNTDNPAIGVGDDETVTSIRKRGYEICDGNSPIDTVCRDARSHGNMFNSETKTYTKDKLAIPCNTYGLLCRNKDQHNTTCGDYEIKFECLSASELPAPENLGVIGVAAGLSVIVPILCVAIMHVARMLKERRNQGRQSLVGNSEQSVQTDSADLPPSYSFLFGESTVTTDVESGSTSTRTLSISLTGSSGDLRLPTTRLSSSNLLSVADNQTPLNSPLPPEEGATTSAQSSNTNQRTSWQSRFPNMHLSVFDLFNSSGQRSEPQSPTLSYVQTPPPTYKDAIIILGGQPFMLSDNGEIGEKI